MALRVLILLSLVLLVAALPDPIHIDGDDACKDLGPLSRGLFPKGFIFGAASSAYQIEGGVQFKGKSIWDNFTHTPGKIADNSTGDVAIDSYHLYKDDIDALNTMSMDAYRFSIAWSRILPNGSLSGGVNKDGITYYNNLINEITQKGMVPFATLFHWDAPQVLEDEYGGFLSEKIVNDYLDYVNICFYEFGDRVKHWITFNEPWTFSSNGYSAGVHAPGRCSCSCVAGNSATEPYFVTHNILRAHAKAVQRYRQIYQKDQNGIIGITLNCHWMVPYSDSAEDAAAQQRALDFMLGWFLHPITFGDYPTTMRENVGKRLPKFTQEESEMLKESYDFVGINYYTAFYAKDVPWNVSVNVNYNTDSRADLSGERDNVPIGPPAASSWLHIYPVGIYKLLNYTKQVYNNPVIYITENGVDDEGGDSVPLITSLNDTVRIGYYQQHICYVVKAITEGVDVKGYFAWSILDNFEWDVGYTVRFGLVYVDFNNDLKRIPKKSATWFHDWLHNPSYIQKPALGGGFKGDNIRRAVE